MDPRRLQLHNLLLALDTSIRAAYFQPPNNLSMQYPCIRYARTSYYKQYADNVAYRNKKQYTLTLIGFGADSDVPDKVAALPLCRHDRQYIADNLIHDVFTLYY